MFIGRTFSKENEVLLDLLANSLFDAGIAISFSETELDQLFAEAKAQTVLALAFDALPPEAREQKAEVYDQWKFLAFSIIQKNIRQVHSNAELEKIFDTINLPFCTIKGFASGYYYGEKRHLRQMGDIDFIVPAETMEVSKERLLEKGYEYIENSEKHDFHIAFQKDGELYEMHKGIISLLDGNEDIEKYIADIFDKSVRKDFDTVAITIPDVFSHGLIMLLHMKRHMLTGGGVGLRHLCDWATFVDSMENTTWIQVFEEKLRKAHLWRFAQVLSKTASIYLKMDEKEWFSDIEAKLAEKLLADILLGGNFGKKSIKRYREVVFLSKTGARENKMVSYSKGIVDKVYSWKPFYKDHKVVLPFGVIAYVFRIFFLTLFRKKKIDFFALQKSGRERDDLYKELFR